MSERELPAAYVKMLDELEHSYLQQTDPIRASGFGGGAERWRAEREPLLDAVSGNGSILDVGCANGHLLACLLEWGSERGLSLIPHGVDRSSALIERARERLPHFTDNLHVGDAWTWIPPRRYEYVYGVYDCVPLDYLPEYVERLLDRAVTNGGRLILGAYGSRSRRLEPFDIGAFLESQGHRVLGRSSGGSPVVAEFAWVDKPPAPAN